MTTTSKLIHVDLEHDERVHVAVFMDNMISLTARSIHGDDARRLGIEHVGIELSTAGGSTAFLLVALRKDVDQVVHGGSHPVSGPFHVHDVCDMYAAAGGQSHLAKVELILRYLAAVRWPEWNAWPVVEAVGDVEYTVGAVVHADLGVR